METVKISSQGREQIIRLPQKIKLDSDEVVVQRVGRSVILTPKDHIWETFLNGINSFTDDCFEDGRSDIPSAERESL